MNFKAIIREVLLELSAKQMPPADGTKNRFLPIRRLYFDLFPDDSRKPNPKIGGAGRESGDAEGESFLPPPP